MRLPSNRQIDRIGRKLAASEDLSEEQDQQYEEFLLDINEAIHDVAERLKGITGPAGKPLEPTPRLKTRTTTIEKLRREPGDLSQIHDIGGARIVINGTRIEQDEVADAIAAAFETTKEPIDRRVQPSFGYRALHVVVRCRNRWIEVQIRTRYQHMWAEVTERFADSWAVRSGTEANPTAQTFRFGAGRVEPLWRFGSERFPTSSPRSRQRN